MTRIHGVPPPKRLLRLAGGAIHDYRMIHEGDRLLLGLSGGKDSLSLLYTLMHLQRSAPVAFDLAAATIDPQSQDFDPSPLKEYLACLNLPYFCESQPILELATQHMKGDSYCAFCARFRRGLLYKIARQKGYNVLVLAQHLDDLAESLLMSMFYGGKLQTMKAHYLNDQGDIRVIRPFIYVRERQTRDFVQQHRLPVIVDNCPSCFKVPQERQAMKELLAREEQRHSRIFKSLLSALRPLLGEPPVYI